MSRVVDGMILVVCSLLMVAAGASAQQTTSATETKTFEVIAVVGNQLDVRFPEGTREITVPDDFRFTVDGKQLSVHELRPGMKGTANITTKTTVTPVTVTEVKNGTVVMTGGGSIYVRTDEGIKLFSQSDVDKRGVKIMRNGQPAQVSDFRQGDTLSATIVTTRPPRVVTEKEVQASLAKTPAPAAAAATAASAAAAATTGTTTPAPASAPRVAANTAAPATSAPPPSAPRELPKTASSLPLLALAGFASLLLAMTLTVRRRRLSR